MVNPPYTKPSGRLTRTLYDPYKKSLVRSFDPDSNSLASDVEGSGQEEEKKKKK